MTAEQIRKGMGPEFCVVADALRERFEAKIAWLEEPLRIGTPIVSEPIGEKAWIRERDASAPIVTVTQGAP